MLVLMKGRGSEIAESITASVGNTEVRVWGNSYGDQRFQDPAVGIRPG